MKIYLHLNWYNLTKISFKEVLSQHLLITTLNHHKDQGTSHHIVEEGYEEEEV